MSDDAGPSEGLDHSIDVDPTDVGPSGVGDPGAYPIEGEPPDPSRRRALKLFALGAAGVGAAGLATWKLAAPDDAPSVQPVDHLDAPILVLVELGGGNDGWSTLVPYESGRYHDLRPTLALDGDRVVDWGDGWGLNARLKGLGERGLTILDGVGTTKPDLSHFEMFDRWHRGNPDPSGTVEPGATAPTFADGFLGRLCDAIGEPGELTGISLHWGDHPSLRARAAATTGLGDMGGNLLALPKRSNEVRSLLSDLTGGRVPAPLREVQSRLAAMIGILDLVQALPDTGRGYPDTALGSQLEFASQLVQSGLGVRVIHVPMGDATFDTHQRHATEHDALMVQLNDGLCAFLDDLEAAGLADQVLVATASEFGRRPEEHGNGLDHGTASVMMLAGPTVPGHHGEPASLTQFDDLDNLVATLEFDRYYATLASWLDVDPAQVLPVRNGSVAEPIAGLLRR